MNRVLCLAACACLILGSGCDWNLDNPSDSRSGEYTVKSKASISVLEKGPYYQLDTVSFSGGVTSEPVEKEELVDRYDWDLGSDGKSDTTLHSSAVLRVPLLHSGSYSVSICLTDGLGNKSRDAVTIDVLPRVNKVTVSAVDDGPYYQLDTVSFSASMASRPVTGLDYSYEWDFGNDGTTDTTLHTPAVLRVPVFKSGTYSVAVNLTDGLGNKSSDIATIVVLPRFKLDILFPDTIHGPSLPIDTSCAFYSQSEYTMKPVVLLGCYLTYRNKTESMALGDFVFELLKNLTGTIDYKTLSLPYKTGHKDGVYTLRNDDLTMKAVFRYGSTTSNHNENDTIKSDLFDPHSYIKSFGAKLTSPYYSYEQGPLWELTSGFTVDVSNPLDPKLSLKIDLSDVKFSGSREVQSRYTMTAQMEDANKLTEPALEAMVFSYHGVARIDPFKIKDIVSIVGNDSLQIDMAGSEIVSDSFPMKITLVNGIDTSNVSYNFLLDQKMLEQKAWFGNSGGNRKVAGDYKAESRLSVADMSMVKSFFSGVYSTTTADTASFFCDEDMTSEFGTLYFDTPQNGYLKFVSDRYAYQFTMKEGLVEPK